MLSGAWLFDQLTQKGWTMSRLARATGLSRRRVMDIVQSEAQPTLEEMRLIIATLAGAETKVNIDSEKLTDVLAAVPLALRTLIATQETPPAVRLGAIKLVLGLTRPGGEFTEDELATMLAPVIVEAEK